MASASVVNPTEGDKIVLSANGTIDSQIDMDSLQFIWDIDITKDSDGDGNPSNDEDYTGRWIEFSYDSEGPKQAKLTVLDESSSHSVTMDIHVAEAPFSLSESLKSNLLFVIIGLLGIAGTVFLVLRTTQTKGKEPPKEEEPLDFDDAFDGPSEERHQLQAAIRPPAEETPETKLPRHIIDGLDDVLAELTGSRPSSGPSDHVPSSDSSEPVEKGVLDLDDIEALFEE